jgi:hypothetical protein
LATHLFVVDNQELDFEEIFERSLFHENQHLTLQAKSGWIKFSILNPEKKQSEAFFPVHIQDKKASSPYKSPYGSIVFSTLLSPKTLYDFLVFVESELVKIGVEEIYIQNPPLAYQPQNINLLHVLLLNSGYTIVKAELSSVLYVDGKSFYSKVNTKQQQRLDSSRANNLSFKILDVAKLEEVYSTISQWQQAKGYSLSMSLEDLSKVIQMFPQRFILTVVNQDDILVAAAISIKVTSGIVYNFYLSHNPDFNNLSPVLVLLEGIYAHCQRQSIYLFDLGTSSLLGKPNFPLLDFKRRLGSEHSSKFAFSKVLNL